jgi:cysteine desulfurase family protein (TIGR01976 family)
MTTTATEERGRSSERTVASPAEIRRDFPALERVQDGVPVAYFDGPGGTQVPRQVADAMVDYLFRHNANTHWRYPTSEETDALIAGARETLADFLNASAEEIAFGQNMTTLTFHLARGLARAWKAGDEVVVTELDHHANVAPWRALAVERGIVVRSVRMDAREGRLDWRDLERQVGPRTRLVAVGAASNALGTISDARAVAELARAAGALSFIDAVHFAPHHLVDVRDIGCDFLACSAYKFYGPHLGILYGRRELLERVEVPRLEPAPNTAPERLETGTQNHEGIVGAAAAVDYLASLARLGPVRGLSGRAHRRESLRCTFDALHRRGEALIGRLWNALSDMKHVTLYGPSPGAPRTPTLAFTVKGRSTDDVATALARQGLFLSNGDFYAATVMERLGRGADGVVRAGCACYTTEDEVARLHDAVSQLG